MKTAVPRRTGINRHITLFFVAFATEVLKALQTVKASASLQLNSCNNAEPMKVGFLSSFSSAPAMVHQGCHPFNEYYYHEGGSQ